MDELQKLKESFFVEADDILEAMDRDLIELEQDPGNMDILNSIFRGMHTLKGSSGIFDMHALERFAHLQEDLLDHLRGERVAPTGEMLDLFFDCLDVMKAIMSLLKENEEVDYAICVAAEARLKRFLPERETKPKVKVIGSVDPGLDREFASALDADARAACRAAAEEGLKIYQIGIRLNKFCFNRAIDPLLLLKSMGYDGRVIGTRADMSRLPDLRQLDPLILHVGDVRAYYATKLGLQETDALFEFAHPAGKIEIHRLPPAEIKELFNVECDEFWLEGGDVGEKAAEEACVVDRALFHAEMAASVEELEASLVKLEKSPGDAETLNSAFRLFHNIKGNSEIFAYSEISAIAHSAETVLDRIRSGEASLTPSAADALLKAVDELKRMLASRCEGLVANAGDGGAAKRLGEILVEMGEITDDELVAALA